MNQKTTTKKYLAYVKMGTVKSKSETSVFAIIGTNSEDILEKSLKYGTDPVFVSGMHELNKGWDNV